MDCNNRKAVFLDRDGVINRIIMRAGKPCSPRTIQDFEWEDGVKDAIEQIKERRFIVIVVTNQPDIARGKMPVDTLDAMTQKIYSEITVDAVMICPHDDIDECSCRKPKPGMLLDAAKMWSIDCGQSFMIGDTWKDTEAGYSAGCSTILLDREYNRDVSCDHRAANLEEAVKFIVKSNL